MPGKIVKPEVILFDLDDTLIIEKQSADEAFAETAKILTDNFQINPVDFVKTIRQEARKIWYTLPTIDYCLKIGISSWEGLWAGFGGKHKQLKLLSQLANDYRENAWYNALLAFGIKNRNLAIELSGTFIIRRNEKHFPYKETLKTLKMLSGSYRMGIITNGAPEIQWTKIKGSGIKDFFEHIIISGEVDYGKPDKEIFEYALKEFKVIGKKTIMIGNSLLTDIAGAQNCGIPSVWLNRDNILLEGSINPDFIIKNLTELVDLLK